MSSHRVDEYGHKLLSHKDPNLEKKINRLAKRYATARDDPGRAARALRMRTEIVTLSLKYFYVAGQGMGGRCGTSFDDILVDTLYYVLEKYEPEKGAFTRYVRYKYKRMRKDMADKEDRIQGSFVQFVEQASRGEDSEEENRGAVDETASPELVSVDDPMLGDSDANGQAEAAIAEFVTLVISFLDHLPDKRHNELAKTYMKMNFTEWTTYAVKIQPTFEGCEPFERQERRIFVAVENGFLNVYMAGECANVRELWDTNLKEGFGEIIKLDDPRLLRKKRPVPWKLAISVHLDYLTSIGIEVTAGAVSQHRGKFRELIQELSLSA